jgi:fumarate hydratase class II
MGNDVAITVGGMQGHYELNVLNPWLQISCNQLDC